MEISERKKKKFHKWTSQYMKYEQMITSYWIKKCFEIYRIGRLYFFPLSRGEKYSRLRYYIHASSTAKQIY